MGHATRNANRAAGIADNKAKVKEIGKSMDALLKEWKIHVKAHTAADEETELFRGDIENRLSDLEGLVVWNALPFYRKWWSRLWWWWKQRKDSNTDPEGGSNMEEGASNENPE